MVALGTYERGERVVTAPALIHLAAVYGVAVADLMPGQNPPGPDLYWALERIRELVDRDAASRVAKPS